MDINIDFRIKNGKAEFRPVIAGDIIYDTNNLGGPSILEFNVVKDNVINFTEGNNVSLIVNGKKLFYGFIFQKSRGKNGVIKVRAYDQLRYFKNRYTMEFTPRTADKYVKRLANQVRATCGELEDTKYVIKYTTENSVTLLDMIIKALNITKQNTGEEYILYDDYMKLTLKNVKSLVTDCYIFDSSLEDFTYTTSIDDTYTKVMVVRDDGSEKTKAEIFEEKDANNIDKWGALLHSENISSKEENPKAKAVEILKQHNKKKITLSLQNVLGDLNVRGGSSVFVDLDLGDMRVKQWLQVVTCKHKISKSKHLMDLVVKGGVIGE